MISGSVLVVDDDQVVLRCVEGELRQQGVSVKTAADADTALRLFSEGEKPALVILDISICRGPAPRAASDGLELLSRVREASDVPVIMLSATTAETVKILALDLGADDYVTKPFSPKELTARVKAVMRRHAADRRRPEQLRFGRLMIDFSRHAVFKDGEPVSLTPKEFGLLAALARADGRVLSRQTLIDAAWGFNHHVQEQAVDVHISHLRRKLEDDPSSPEIVMTLRGAGYRLGTGRVTSCP